MKNILLFAFLLTPFLCLSQSVKDIYITFDNNDFNLVQSDTTYRIESDKYILLYDSDTTKPAVPYILVNVLIGQNSLYSHFQESSTCHTFANSIILCNNKSEGPTSYSSLFPNKAGIQNYNSLNLMNSNENTIFAGCYTMNGYNYVSFYVYPFEYDVMTHNLYLKDQIQISIFTVVAQNPNNNYVGELQQNAVRKFIFNPDDIDSLYNYTIQNYNTEYLIITCDSMKSIFQTLANWKIEKGIKTKLVTVESIDSLYSDNLLQHKIKRYIKSLYESTNKCLKYVLIGGGTNVVPSVKTWMILNSELSEPPTDYYYSCLKDIEWDTNHDDKAGEVEDSIDIYPQLIVSRLVARNIQDAEVLVNRTLEYETNPKTANWNNEILMCGNHYGSNNYTDVYYNALNLYSSSIEPYWNGNRILFYNSYTDFEGGANFDFTPENFQSVLAKGYTFVELDTHGSNKDLMTETYYYNISRVPSQVINQYTNFVTTSCTTNSFDVDTCLSYELMRNPNCNIISYMGSSRAGWQTESYYYAKKYYQYLLSGSTHKIGDAFYDMKVFYSNYSHNKNKYRWLLLSLNLLGDPELDVYLERPQSFTNVTCQIINDSLVLNTGVDSCKICVMSTKDFGNTYYEVHDNCRNVVFNNIDDITICISKSGYIPYRKRLIKDNFIQNEIINKNTSIRGGYIQIGRNVTSTKPEGPVEINNNSNVSIESTNGVWIKNSFEVKIGSTLTIE